MLPMVRAQGVEPLVIPELGRDLSVRNDLVTLIKLYRLFRRWRPDVVETHTAKAGTLGRVAALKTADPARCLPCLSIRTRHRPSPRGLGTAHGSR